MCIRDRNCNTIELWVDPYCDKCIVANKGDCMVGFSEKKESKYLPQHQTDIFLMVLYFVMTTI